MDENHSACLPTILWKAKGTDSVLFSILFSPEDKEETKERAQSFKYKKDAHGLFFGEM